MWRRRKRKEVKQMKTKLTQIVLAALPAAVVLATVAGYKVP